MRALIVTGLVLLSAAVVGDLWLLRATNAVWEELANLEEEREALDRLTFAWRDLNRPGNDVLADYDHARERAAFERYVEELEAARAHLASFEARSPRAGPFLGGFQQALGEMRASTETIFAATEERGRLVLAEAETDQLRAAEARAALSMTVMDRAFQQGLDAIAAYQKAIGRELSAHLGNQRTNELQAYGLVAIVILLAGLSVEVARRSARQRRDMVNVTQALAVLVRENDFGRALPQADTLEGRELVAAFDNLVARLRAIHTTLQQASERLAASMGALRSATGHFRESAERQSVALHETQVTTEELRRTSAHAAERAQSVLDVSRVADELARDGESALADALAGLGRIGEHSGTIASRVEQLVGGTRQIGGITETVKGFADQSNMLALNAAIEASRSGEHGKGFAVVAREIRSLADQSIQATARVRRLLEVVNVAIEEASRLARDGGGQTQEGIDQVRLSTDRLRALAEAVRNAASSARQIAAAVAQQDVGVRQIFDAVADQMRMMQESVTASERAANAVLELDAVSRSITDVTSGYRV